MKRPVRDPRCSSTLALAIALGLGPACEKSDTATATPADAAAADPGSTATAADDVGAAGDETAPADDPLADIAGPDEKPPEFSKDEQIEKGMALYDAKCGGCHGKDGLGGKKSPAVMGSDAFSHGKYGTADALRSYILGNMPPKESQRLDGDEADAVTAFILNANGTELPGPLWSGNRDGIELDFGAAE